MSPAHALGRRAEDLAHRHLQASGLTVIDRNWRTRDGMAEVDLIAWEGEVLAFVEVKARSSTEHGSPERNVDQAKRMAVRRAALRYARKLQVDTDRIRLDLVTVVDSRPPVLEHRRGVFSLFGGHAVS